MAVPRCTAWENWCAYDLHALCCTFTRLLPTAAFSSAVSITPQIPSAPSCCGSRGADPPIKCYVSAPRVRRTSQARLQRLQRGLCLTVRSAVGAGGVRVAVRASGNARSTGRCRRRPARARAGAAVAARPRARAAGREPRGDAGARARGAAAAGPRRGAHGGGDGADEAAGRQALLRGRRRRGLLGPADGRAVAGAVLAERARRRARAVVSVSGGIVVVGAASAHANRLFFRELVAMPDSTLGREARDVMSGFDL